MPKLPLDPAKLRAVPGAVGTALRHPRRTAARVVNGTFSQVGDTVGKVLDRRPAGEPVPGMADEPDGPAADAPPGPVAAEPALPPEEAVTQDGAAPVEGEPAEQLTGPAPHMRHGIAHDVERDFEEDIPGIKPGRPES